MKAKVIAITNEKGGVGKTTTAKNLSYNLSLKGKTLLVDFDPQMNTTKGLGILDHTADITSLFDKKVKIRSIKRTRYPEFDIVPGNRNLALMQSMDQENFFNNFTEIKKKYDYIVLDTSPYFNELTALSILVSDLIVIPIEAEADSIEGMASTINEVKELKGSNSTYKILITKTDNKRKQNREDIKSLLQGLGSNVFATTISYAADEVRNTRMRNSVLAKTFKKRKVTEDYQALCNELLKEVF